MASTKALAIIDQLNETAIKYNQDIKYAPLSYNRDEFAKMGVLMVPGVQNKHIDYLFLRRGSIMRPYTQGMQASMDELGKFKQNEMQVYRAAGIEKDNIQNYRTTTVGGMKMSPAEIQGRNPADPFVFYALSTTWGEDLKDALWHAVRNDAGTTKYDLFDGYETMIQAAILTGEISKENGNLIPTQPITFPLDETDTSAYDIVDDFLTRARVGAGVLNVTKLTARAIRSAVFNKFRYTMLVDQFNRYIIPGHEDVRLNINTMMGEGDRMVLSKGDIFQFGYDTQFDDPFVRARLIDDDDQIITYNLGAVYGTAIRSFHEKFFCTNDGSLSPVALAGDYRSPEKYTVGVENGTNGTASIEPVKALYALGDQVTATATPNAGYVFEKWSDGSLNNPNKFMVKGNVSLTPTYKPE